MGSPTMSVQSSTQSGGKGFGSPTPDSQKPDKVTFAGQTAQPVMGQPNQYSNTVSPWDNQQQQQTPQPQIGKGKGA